MAKRKVPAPQANDKALKHLFGSEHLSRLAKALGGAEPKFNKSRLTSLCIELEALEMKPRVRLIRDTLKALLPEKYSAALVVLVKSVKNGGLKGFDLWPITEFIQTYGLADEKRSLAALKFLTTRFTAEWAIRPFLRQDPETTLAYLLECARHKNVHVRRWASEGARPRLPWGERLNHFISYPKSTLKILEILKYDSELYVRKSVANHLNDISKDHPDLVIKLLARWKRDAADSQQNRVDWIISRALRTLIKEGHRDALGLIGVSPDAKISMSSFRLHNSRLKVGDRLEFSFTLVSSSNHPQNLVVDYVIHYLRANKKHSAKVFKLKNIVIAPRQSISVRKSHHLKEVTTRALYGGKHALEIQINGIVRKRCDWELDKRE